jgi:hypothetical protein
LVKALRTSVKLFSSGLLAGGGLDQVGLPEESSGADGVGGQLLSDRVLQHFRAL